MSQETTRPLILVTNDDGITAPGIRNLVESIADLGDIVVVAPDSHQSGMGHAITISNILRMSPHDFGTDGVEAYKTSGLFLSKASHAENSRAIDLQTRPLLHTSNQV